MGVDFLDLQFHVEKVFGLRLSNDDLRELLVRNDRFHDVTVAQLLEFIESKSSRVEILVEEYPPVLPLDAYTKILAILVEVTGLEPHTIQPESFLRRDLDMQ